MTTRKETSRIDEMQQEENEQTDVDENKDFVIIYVCLNHGRLKRVLHWVSRAGLAVC